ncbi:MAG: Lrp/AsnC family transcriptional regulator [Pseudomonadota bacterium]
MKFSDQEKRLLDEIQSDTTRSLAELAETIGMAQSTLWRKLQEFEATGLIRSRVALLDPAKAGAKLCVLASVSLHDHNEAAVDGFAALVKRLPEILECHSVSGTADYILKIRCRDVEAYEVFMTRNVLRSEYVQSVVSSFALKEIKSTTALPLQ